MSEQAPQRLGVIGTDRPCIRCGFNLHGQPIVREDHYAMVIARCPECGEVAALQEYPALGRWAGRLAGAGALAWLGLVLVAGIGTASFLHYFARQAMLAVVYPSGLRLATQYREYALEKAELITDPVQRQNSVAWLGQYPVEGWPIVGPDAVGDGTAKAALAAIPASERLDWTRARAIGWIVLWGVPIGMAWAVLTPHLKRRGMAVMAIVLTLCGGVWTALAVVQGAPAQVWGSYYWGVDLAYAEFGWQWMPLGLTIGGLALYAGMLVGRPFARLMVVLLLPPRLRAPLGSLWTLQGLNVPGTARR